MSEVLRTSNVNEQLSSYSSMPPLHSTGNRANICINLILAESSPLATFSTDIIIRAALLRFTRWAEK